MKKWLNTNMLKSIFILILGTFIIFPNLSIASYYAQDYDPSYLPYNFQDAVNADYSGCNTVLNQYNDGYWQLDEKFEALKKGITYNGPVWMPIGKQSAFNLDQLRTYTEEEIRLCLIDYREYEEEQAQEAEEKAKKAAEEKAIAERQAEVQEAIAKCDFAFFEKMTSTEKMQTYDEREACKNKTVSTPSPAPTPTPTPIAVPVIQNTPTYTPPVTTTYTAPANNSTEVVTTDIEAQQTVTTDTATITPETVETTTQEQTDEAEEVNEQPEQKPSIFKRVVNFLFGWLL